MRVRALIHALASMPQDAEVYFVEDHRALRVDALGHGARGVVLFHAGEIPTRSGAPGSFEVEPQGES